MIGDARSQDVDGARTRQYNQVLRVLRRPRIHVRRNGILQWRGVVRQASRVETLPRKRRSHAGEMDAGGHRLRARPASGRVNFKCQLYSVLDFDNMCLHVPKTIILHRKMDESLKSVRTTVKQYETFW